MFLKRLSLQRTAFSAAVALLAGGWCTACTTGSLEAEVTNDGGTNPGMDPKPGPPDPEAAVHTWGEPGIAERATTVVVDPDQDGLYVTGTIDAGGWFATKLDRTGEVLWHHTMSEAEVPLTSRITDDGDVLVLSRVTDAGTATEATYGEVRAHWLSRADGLEADPPRVFVADAPIYAGAAQLLDGSFVVTGAIAEIVHFPDFPEGGVPMDRFWVGEFDLAAGSLMSSWRGGELVGGPKSSYAFHRGTSVAVSAAGVATVGCEYYPDSLGDEPMRLRFFDRELGTMKEARLGHGDLQCAKGQDTLVMDDAGHMLVVGYEGYTAGYQVRLREFHVGPSGELEYRGIALPRPYEMKVFAVGDMRMGMMDLGPTPDIPDVTEDYPPAWIGLELDESSALGPSETIVEPGEQRLEAAALVSGRTVALVGHRGDDALLVFFDLP